MRLVIRFFKRPFADHLLFLEATFWLGMARLAILTLPFNCITPFLGRHMASYDKHYKSGNRETEISVCRAILTMGRHLPWECKCLSQAISAKMMLRRRKIPSTLYLAVAKQGNRELIAHAWLRAGDLVLIGARGMERFTVVSTFA
jgi:hypothetical protein